MDTEQDLDFSAGSAPDSWYEAAALAPKGDERALQRPSAIPILPHGRSMDLPMAMLSTVAVAVVCGASWYALQTRTSIQSQWLAVPMGALIAAATRLGGGRHDRETRAAVAGLFYLVTLIVVTVTAAHHSYVDLYAGSPSLVSFEQDLLRSRIANPWNVMAWICGLMATVKLSLVLGEKY